MNTRITQFIYPVTITLLWLLCTGWLFYAKLLPTLLGGEAPAYTSEMPAEGAEAEPVYWKMIWKGRQIGYAANHVVATDTGAEMRSLVRFEKLELAAMLQELFGPLAALMAPVDEKAKITLQVANRAHLDEDSVLQKFESVVDLPGAPRMIEVEGVSDGKGSLEITANMQSNGDRQQMFNRTIEAPSSGSLGDGFAPRARMTGLKIGQKWTVPVRQTFSPTQAIQMLEAEVTHHELIFWNGDTIETLVVVYRPEASSNIGAARKPNGRMWVTRSGEVLRQQVIAANLMVEFQRIADGKAPPGAEAAIGERFPNNFADAATAAGK